MRRRWKRKNSRNRTSNSRQAACEVTNRLSRIPLGTLTCMICQKRREWGGTALLIKFNWKGTNMNSPSSQTLREKRWIIGSQLQKTSIKPSIGCTKVEGLRIKSKAVQRPSRRWNQSKELHFSTWMWTSIMHIPNVYRYTRMTTLIHWPNNLAVGSSSATRPRCDCVNSSGPKSANFSIGYLDDCVVPTFHVNVRDWNQSMMGSISCRPAYWIIDASFIIEADRPYGYRWY